MENGININQLREMTIGDIKKLESQQSGLHDIIQEQKERLKFYDEQIKTGNFAEDLVGTL